MTVSSIHITEEARHLCFARNFLEERVPRLSKAKRIRLGIAAPFILREMARMMLEPSGTLIRRYQIPSAVIREAFMDNPAHKANVQRSVASVVQLCRELRILNRKNAWLWKRLGVGA